MASSRTQNSARNADRSASLDERSGKVSHQWRCGHDFETPLPTPNNDPWDQLLKPMLDRDAEQCNAWVDEVQNLLLFAGLFSAVVTAFAVETYKGLQPDPVVVLLAQIAVNMTNSTLPQSPSLAQTTPGSSTVRLNIFLFLSLTLSLSSVLVGIVALQWIREHRRHSNTLTPQNMFSTIHMRTEALHRWHVPTIFATLPLILQSALIFFFAGIFQLLLNTSAAVLLPVAGVMGATILFLLLTTILPTAQAATLTEPHDNIPSPCPYKSPQSNACRRLIASSESLFRVACTLFVAVSRIIHYSQQLLQRTLAFVACISFIIGVLRLTLRPVISILNRASNWVVNSGCGHGRWDAFDYMKPRIFGYWRQHSWFDFDIGWMSIRDGYFQSICPADSWLCQHRTDSEQQDSAGLFDATKGLCQGLTEANYNLHVHAEPAIITAYHCVLDLCSPSLTHYNPKELLSIKRSQFRRTQYLTTLLGLGDLTPLRPFSPSLDCFEIPTLREEASFVFLSYIQEHLSIIGERSPLLANHYAEIYFRLVGELYSRPYKMETPVAPDSLPPKVAFDGEELYVMKIYDAPDQPFTYQWALSISSFFITLSNHKNDDDILLTSFHNHPFFSNYDAYFWSQVKYEVAKQTIQDATVKEITGTLAFVDSLLDECFSAPATVNERTGHNRDMILFRSASIHIWNCREKHIHCRPISEAADATLERLYIAKQRLLAIDILDNRFPTSTSTSVPPRDRSWQVEDWWKGLFEVEGSSQTNIAPAGLSSAHHPGDLVVEVHS